MGKKRKRGKKGKKGFAGGQNRSFMLILVHGSFKNGHVP